MQDLPFSTCLPWQDATVRDDPFSCYRREFDYLYRTLRRLGIAPSDIEDLIHEIFLVLHAKWDDYDPSRPLRPYLFGIAYRTVLAYRRRRREVPSDQVDPLNLEMGPDELLEAEQARELVLAALQTLPYERRAVFVMHELDDASMHDVARALGIPLFTAYSRLRKARREFEAAVTGLSERCP